MELEFTNAGNKPGVYWHHKNHNDHYFLAGIATNHSDAEEMVVYMSLETRKFFVKPLMLFNSEYELICPTTAFMFDDLVKRIAEGSNESTRIN